MLGQLITIATFDLVPKARLAQNILESAGIKSVVTDENIVAMDWLFGNAVGWVKVQVLEEDAERAVAELERSLGPDNEPVDPDALAREAVGSGDEVGAGDEEVKRSTPVEQSSRRADRAADTTTDEAAPQRSERDEYARRTFLASVFSILFPPLWFYAIYLLLNAQFGDGPISERGRNDLLRGAAILGAGLLVLFACFMSFRVFFE